jgi:hypothetical protein
MSGPVDDAGQTGREGFRIHVEHADARHQLKRAPLTMLGIERMLGMDPLAAVSPVRRYAASTCQAVVTIGRVTAALVTTCVCRASPQKPGTLVDVGGLRGQMRPHAVGHGRSVVGEEHIPHRFGKGTSGVIFSA